jgi:hypothetical protein
MTETFVFEGVEVSKTGRTAIREIKKPNGTVASTTQIVEIKPIDDSMEWKKWVDPKLLFIVQ